MEPVASICYRIILNTDDDVAIDYNDENDKNDCLSIPIKRWAISLGDADGDADNHFWYILIGLLFL